ncbi:EF-hand domain-containing protein [Novosphingobium sp. KCTC 2891]|uniref:EF-hand domain-containing protein n=1 Tax=Novosphingobium sp. KCTC 2891 TaxID=2989730 RepID=UPI0022231C68|nr:EF-hand domain-containing protein [Novosphingobium sp. KCTC 2891]MCW1382316.1 EF-hand domain-containing protein [Novosphingobium sp. KCTC 2891]
MLRAKGPIVPLMAAALALVGGCRQKETGPEAGASATAPVVAATPAPVTRMSPAQNPLTDFVRLDADRDGRVSSAEYAQANQALFDRIDMEHDGNLGPGELDAAVTALGGVDGLTTPHLLALADTDHDGKLTLAEWMAFANARFTRIDVNGDGFIDRAEWDAPQPAPSAGPDALP